MSKNSTGKTAGITQVHSRRCPKGRGGSGERCNCKPKHEPWVYDPATGRKIRKRFDTVTAAKLWRREAQSAIDRGSLRAPGPLTVREAGEQLVVGMLDGSILSRSKRPYKPSTCRDYSRILHQYIVPELGDRRVGAITRRDVEEFVDTLRRRGLSPSTLHNVLDPLRVIFRRARRQGEILIDPTDDLELPAIRGRRDRIEPPQVAEELIAALPESEQAFWACALFAGLRRGELRALRVCDLDFDEEVITPERGWDPVEGIIDLKSTAAYRSIPMAGIVREKLLAHVLQSGRRGSDLVFGRTATEPFYPSTVRFRAYSAWGWRQTRTRIPGTTKSGAPRTLTTWVKASEDALEPLSPHEARHCAASYFLAAGMDWREVMEWIGHSDVRQTINRYAHTQKGAQKGAARKLDALIEDARRRAV